MTAPTTYPTSSAPQQQASPDAERRQGLFARLAQAKEQQKLVDWAQQSFARARSDRTRLERQWYLNLAFYGGRQNVEFKPQAVSPLGAQLVTPQAPPWRVRLVVNKTKPAVLRHVAKLTAQQPNFEVVPATNSDEDAAAARVGEQVLESQYRDLEVRFKLGQALWWSANTGTAYLKDYWHAGYTDPRSKARGRICVEPVDPFHLLVPDLREAEVEGQPWVMHATTRPREWVKTYYNADVPASTKSSEALYEDVMRDGAAAPRDQVLCLEVWCKAGAHRSLPEGGVLTVVGDKLVQLISGWPLQHGEFPFTKLEDQPTGRWYGTCIVDDFIPLQRELNRTRSQLVEQKNLMGRPKGLFPQGGMDPSKVTSEPGQWIPYQPALGKPDILPAPPIPGYVIDLMDRVTGDMDDVSGQHEISRGGTPAQVTAATAISYLQEQDDTMLGPAVASVERGMARLGKHLLGLVVQFWDQPRMVRAVGPDGAFDVQQFTGSALRGNTDVQVEAGSALPTSKAARSAQLTELYKLGAFGAPGADPQAGQQLLKAMGLRGVDALLEDVLVDQRQAQRENTRLSAGEPVPVNSYDNHAAHIPMHNRFRKGQAFEQLPDQAKAVFAQHVADHEQALLAGQAVAGSAPSGDGGQPAPQGGTLAPPGPPQPSALPQPTGG